MQIHIRQDEHTSELVSLKESSHSFDDFFSFSGERSLKRAKSVKDAFPPFPHSSASSRRRQYKPNCKRKYGDRSTSYDKRADNIISSSEASDTESLPDLSDSYSTTSSTQSAITPVKTCNATQFFCDFASISNGRKALFQSELSLQRSAEREQKPSIFEIPELVYKIIEYADLKYTVVPHEAAPIRRKPLSMEHALLMYNGNEERALAAMEQHRAGSTSLQKASGNVLFNCLLVNKLFYRIAKEIINSKIFFSDESSFYKFAKSGDRQLQAIKPELFVLNKMYRLKQAPFEFIAQRIDFSAVHKFELFMCPKIKPPTSCFHPALKSLIVTASRVMNDSILVSVAQKCPNLEVLDLRACDYITDYGIYNIGTKCHKLQSINLGRKHNGHLITDHSVATLAANNANLHTAGFAGCHITDHSIWNLALSSGSTMERLSLNNCIHITDQSLPEVLLNNLMPRLSVLEIRYMDNLTNVEPIVVFKRRQEIKGFAVLIEACESLLRQIKECERRMDNIVSNRIHHELAEWANSKDDGDLPYSDFLRAHPVVILS